MEEEEEDDEEEKEEEEEEEEERAEVEENAAKFAVGNKDGFSARSRKRFAGDACSTKDRERVNRRLARDIRPERDQMYLTKPCWRGIMGYIGGKERENDDMGQRKGDGGVQGTVGGC